MFTVTYCQRVISWASTVSALRYWHELKVGPTRSVYLIFTARYYASAVLAMGQCLSVCVCVCLSVSVTSRSSTKTAKRRITQTTPHDSPGTLVF